MQYAELPFKTLRPIHQPWGKREIVSAATKLPEGAAQMFPNIQSTPGKHLLVGRVGSAPTRNRCEKWIRWTLPLFQCFLLYFGLLMWTDYHLFLFLQPLPVWRVSESTAAAALQGRQWVLLGRKGGPAHCSYCLRLFSTPWEPATPPTAPCWESAF